MAGSYGIWRVLRRVLLKRMETDKKNTSGRVMVASQMPSRSTQRSASSILGCSKAELFLLFFFFFAAMEEIPRGRGPGKYAKVETGLLFVDAFVFVFPCGFAFFLSPSQSKSMISLMLCPRTNLPDA